MLNDRCLEPESLRSALDTLRQGEPLPVDHPLLYCLSLRRSKPLPVAGRAVTESLIFDSLTRLIHRKLNQHRHLYSLNKVFPKATRVEAEQEITQDFHQPNAELKAWSYLYYRYVRVDLDLSVEDLAQLTGEARRNLQRRQERALYRLCRVLVRREQAFQRQYHQRVQRARLPFPVPLDLIGRQTLFETLTERLTVGSFPRHVKLLGPKGIGKTALALNVAHHLIDVLPTLNIVWIDAPSTDLDRLTAQIINELGLPSLPENLPALIPEQDTLVVLDHAQALIEAKPAFKQVLRVLGAVRVLVCAEQSENSEALMRLNVPELEQEDALTLLEQLARERNLRFKDDVAYLARLYETFGGVPGALQEALGREGRSAAPHISARALHGTWSRLSQPAQTLWLCVGISATTLHTWENLTRLIPDEILQSLPKVLDNLIRAHVIHAEGEHYRLTALAHTFVEGLLREESERAAVWGALDHIADVAAETHDPVECVRLLDCVTAAEWPLDKRIDLVYALAGIVEHSGAWAAWARYLDSLHPLVTGEDRLWIMLKSGVARRWMAQWLPAGECFMEALRLAGEQGAFDLQSEALIEMAVVHRMRNELQAAHTCLDRAERYFQRVDDTANLQRIAVERIQLLLDADNTQAATPYLETLLAVKQPSPRVAGVLALAALQLSNLEAALDWAEYARDQLADDLPRMARMSALVGQIYHLLNRPDEAIDHLSGAANIMARTDDHIGYARTRLNLASVYVGMGQLRTALSYFEGLPQLFQRLGDLNGLRVAAENLERIQKLLRKPPSVSV